MHYPQLLRLSLLAFLLSTATHSSANNVFRINLPAPLLLSTNTSGPQENGLRISASSLAWREGQAIQIPVSITGGTPPYTINVDGVPGVDYNWGLEAVIGIAQPVDEPYQHDLQITAVDAEGIEAKQTFPVTIYPLMIASVPQTGYSVVKDDYLHIEPEVAQNQGAVTWTLHPDSLLPPGMSFINGAITGSPTVIGDYNEIQLIATDSMGQQTTSPFSIKVTDTFFVAAHPGSMEMHQTDIGTTQVLPGGDYTGPLTYTIVDSTGSSTSIPNWITVSNQGKVLASVPITVPAKKYGPYMVKITESSGKQALSFPFTVTARDLPSLPITQILSESSTGKITDVTEKYLLCLPTTVGCSPWMTLSRPYNAIPSTKVHITFEEGYVDRFISRSSDGVLSGKMGSKNIGVLSDLSLRFSSVGSVQSSVSFECGGHLVRLAL